MTNRVRWRPIRQRRQQLVTKKLIHHQQVICRRPVVQSTRTQHLYKITWPKSTSPLFQFRLRLYTFLSGFKLFTRTIFIIANSVLWNCLFSRLFTMSASRPQSTIRTYKRPTIIVNHKTEQTLLHHAALETTRQTHIAAETVSSVCCVLV